MGQVAQIGDLLDVKEEISCDVDLWMGGMHVQGYRKRWTGFETAIT